MKYPLSYVDPWCRHLPKLHRALADPEVACELPRPPQAVTHAEICAYWETLHYLLHVILGWQNLGSGLAWWYETGKKDAGDPRLKLLSMVWDSEAQLDYFAAWAWLNNGWHPEQHVDADHNGICPKWINEEWWQKFQRRVRVYSDDPFHGGSNPLHLGHSNDYGLTPSSTHCQAHIDYAQHRGTIIVSHINSWRAEFREAAANFPSLGAHSWHMEVFDRSTGYLGLWRQSRVTGLWFQGKHSIHMAGNPQQSKMVI